MTAVVVDRAFDAARERIASMMERAEIEGDDNEDEDKDEDEENIDEFLMEEDAAGDSAGMSCAFV